MVDGSKVTVAAFSVSVCLGHSGQVRQYDQGKCAPMLPPGGLGGVTGVRGAVLSAGMVELLSVLTEVIAA